MITPLKNFHFMWFIVFFLITLLILKDLCQLHYKESLTWQKIYPLGQFFIKNHQFL